MAKQFDEWSPTGPTTSIDGVLKGRRRMVEILLLLQRPEVPKHNNLSEGHIRDYVKKRKISGSTRSDSGRRARDTLRARRRRAGDWE